MYITCSQEPTQNLMAIWMGTMMRLRIGFRGSSHGTFSENPMSCGVCVISHWLVVSTNHPEKWWTSSVGMMTFQIWWDKKKHVPNHQPESPCCWGWWGQAFPQKVGLISFVVPLAGILRCPTKTKMNQGNLQFKLSSAQNPQCRLFMTVG